MTSNAFQIQNFYKEGKTDYFTILAPNGATIDFAGQVPEYFALTHFDRISTCLNCMGLKWCGVIMGMCANCGIDTGAQKGFINYGQECEDASHTNLPSVFDKDQYLANDWDLKRVGDKSFENTIYIMVDELSDHLLYKFGYEKRTAILGLRAYLRSLDHDPRQAIMRINEAWDIPEEELHGRNWANLYWANLFGPHYDENDYIGSDDEERQRETQEEEERQCEASSQSSTDYSSMPALIPILEENRWSHRDQQFSDYTPERKRRNMTRTDTEYHYGLDHTHSTSSTEYNQKTSACKQASVFLQTPSVTTIDAQGVQSLNYDFVYDSQQNYPEEDYHINLSDRRRGASLDTDDDAVSEISNCDVGEVDNANLTAEQQDKIYQDYDDACK